MKYYINVKFGVSNKSYYFATDFADIKIGDFVVVETVVGTEIGEVTTYPIELETLNYDKEVKPILRKANKDDLFRNRINEKDAVAANTLFENYIKELNLDMKLIGSQYTLDRTKILFTYVADDRVDFRELLKVLAAALHCRIELRQINSRERAQLIGGIGTCGLPLCCTTFLKTFDGVTLNRAKNQMLAINIPKISGQCNKLMCCLKYEDDVYTEVKKQFPPLGTKFKYNGLEYKVSSFNIFTKIIKITAENNEVEFLSLDELRPAFLKSGITLASPENKEVKPEPARKPQMLDSSVPKKQEKAAQKPNIAQENKENTKENKGFKGFFKQKKNVEKVENENKKEDKQEKKFKPPFFAKKKEQDKKPENKENQTVSEEKSKKSNKFHRHHFYKNKNKNKENNQN